MGHLDKRKIDSSAMERMRKLFTSEYTNPCAKKKIFLYSNEGTIDYNQQCHPLHLINKQYKQFPQKKKKEKKRMRKRGRESGKKKEKEKKEEKEKEKEKMEKTVLKVHHSLQTHSLTRS